jgi:hypothetical protein
MNSKDEFFKLLGNTVIIEYKDKSIITSIRIIEFGEKTTKFTLLNGDEVTIGNNQKLTRNSEGYIIIEAHNEQSNQ